MGGREVLRRDLRGDATSASRSKHLTLTESIAGGITTYSPAAAP